MGLRAFFSHLLSNHAVISMDRAEKFLAANTFAVAGASNQQHKDGNKAFRALLLSERDTFPLNPNQSVIEGHQAYASLKDLPVVPESLSIITPPQATRQVVAEAISVGVKHIWMQPGAEDEKASESARRAGIEVIDDGRCVLVLLAWQ